jgi:hypothetical protein
MPIVMPTNNAIAFSGVVLVGFETAGAKLKLDPHETFLISNSPVGEAVGKLRADFLDSKILPAGHVREKENDTDFILGRTL